LSSFCHTSKQPINTTRTPRSHLSQWQHHPRSRLRTSLENGSWYDYLVPLLILLAILLPTSIDHQLITPLQNKTLSDDTDAVLALQGIGWFTRRAISFATVTLHVKQYTDEAGNTHIDIEQTATGGIKGTTETRELTWTFNEHEDHIFGKVKGRSRWLGLDAVEDDYLKEGWLEGDEEKSGPAGELHIESYVENNGKGWTADQIWGFSIVDGKRYYVRRIVVKKGSEVMKTRLVYNWQGKK
jgi:hypothetical protein